MNKLFQFAVLFGVATITSGIGFGTHQKKNKKFTVSGSIMQTTGYCGGARPSQKILDSVNTPRGIRFAKLFIKSGAENIGGAPIINAIEADERGDFTISLPAGSYCLLEEWKTRPFKLPPNDARHTVDSTCYSNRYKACDFELRVINQNIHHLKIIFHRTCFYNQPCITYRGPLPSVKVPNRY